MFTAKELTLLRSGDPNIAFVMRVVLPTETLRMCAIFGDIRIPPDTVETEGGVYTCVGRWSGGLPDVDMLMNGQAQALKLIMDGLDRETAKQWLRDRSQTIGARASFGWMVLDQRFHPAGAMHWTVPRAHLTEPRLRRYMSDKGVWRREMSVTLVRGGISRRKPTHTYVTGPDQRRRHPTDRSCDRVAGMNQAMVRIWP